jgi:predicted nucleic acid-binding protein
MIVVADTSPINYLVLIEEIGVLPKMYGHVVIPHTVREERGCMPGNAKTRQQGPNTT